MSSLHKILICILALLCILVVHHGTLDDTSLAYVEQGFKRTLITYGISRGLNGLISVAQGTEVAIEPVGVGVTFTPGEILDPVNDLIERFSWVVLASGTSLGIQRVLLEITSWRPFSLFVTGFIVLSCAMMWWRRTENTVMLRLIYRFTLALLVLRFAVPVISLASAGIYDVFLAPMYVRSSEQLQQTSLVLKDMNQQAEDYSRIQPDQELSFLESAKRHFLSATRQINIQERMQSFKDAAEQVSENAINLIVIFVLQTLLLPLLFAWLIIHLIRWLLFGDVFKRAD